jgi:hypothetical protein
VNDAQLERFARNGGKVLFLARTDEAGAAGLKLAAKGRVHRFVAASDLGRNARFVSF